MAGTTLPGVLLTGTHAARPAANTVATGSIYSENDTGQDYQSDGTNWNAWGAVVMVNPMTTQDDVIVGGAAGAPARLGKGTDGQVLTVDPTTHHLLWATSASGFVNPMTTKADLIAGGASGVATRLPVGANAQVLTADSTQTLGMKWAAGGGGGGASLGYVQSADLATSGGGGTLVLPATPTNGNLIILLSTIAGADITGVTQTGVTWTQLADYVESGQQSGSIYKGVVGASASASIAITNAGGTLAYYAAWELTGKTVSAIGGTTHGQGEWAAYTSGGTGALSNILTVSGSLIVAILRGANTSDAVLPPLLTCGGAPANVPGVCGAAAIGVSPGGYVGGYSGHAGAGLLTELKA